MTGRQCRRKGRPKDQTAWVAWVHKRPSALESPSHDGGSWKERQRRAACRKLIYLHNHESSHHPLLRPSSLPRSHCQRGGLSVRLRLQVLLTEVRRRVAQLCEISRKLGGLVAKSMSRTVSPMNMLFQSIQWDVQELILGLAFLIACLQPRTRWLFLTHDISTANASFITSQNEHMESTSANPTPWYRLDWSARLVLPYGGLQLTSLYPGHWHRLWWRHLKDLDRRPLPPQVHTCLRWTTS